MAAEGAATITEEVRTEGKAVGPVTTNVTYTGMAATVLVFTLGYFGIDVPAEIALAFVTLVIGAVGYFTRGRKTVETKTVFEASSIGAPVGYEQTPAYDTGVTPIPDGTGQHRAEQPLGENNE